VTVSFFNELDTEKELCSGLSIPRLLFHFLTSLLQRGKLCSKTSVSFFNELATERKTMLMTSVSFFNELATEKKKNYARDLCFIF
jgi:hypothetical protein